jgi:hypothetical protein
VIFFASDVNQGEKGVAARVSEGTTHPSRRRRVPIAQAGQSDDSHSPVECASVVVRRMRPASLSIVAV